MDALVMKSPVLSPLADAARGVGEHSLAGQLTAMRDWLGVDLAELEAQLGELDALAQDPEQAKAAAAYLLASGGSGCGQWSSCSRLGSGRLRPQRMFVTWRW